MMGLAGAHRVGKTSLARASAQALEVPFVETSASAVFARYGIAPDQPLSFQERMVIQDAILQDCIEKWSGYKAGFITDRTPIDLMAYTVADIRGDTVPEGADVLVANYLHRCIEAANDHFMELMLIQPGIPVVPAPGKAALSQAYMEHLNTLMMGYMVRKDLQITGRFMQRDRLDFEDRLATVVTTYQRILTKQMQSRSAGYSLH